ncbi:MAG: PBSX family phage terminase large subunit, partial [Oceanicoccus sp.]|uniref:terminase large subunit n=1 Tax=Oceanicoccus sp. TaxID=2691044 RepID=UPI002634B524
SIEDGIKHLRSYKQIIVHPRCAGTIKETRKYSYKVDRLSGDVLPQIVDAHNHYIDAIRYAVTPMIKGKRGGIVLPSGR